MRSTRATLSAIDLCSGKTTSAPLIAFTAARHCVLHGPHPHSLDGGLRGKHLARRECGGVNGHERRASRQVAGPRRPSRF